jgi:hypothetical protein
MHGLIFVILTVVLIVIIFLITKKKSLKDIFKGLNESPDPLILKNIEKEYKNYLLERYGQKGIDFYNSKLKTVTCNIPPDFSLKFLNDGNSPEFQRLKQCGYIYNIALLFNIATAFAFGREDMDFETFKENINKILNDEQMKLFEPSVLNSQMYYGRRYG